MMKADNQNTLDFSDISKILSARNFGTMVKPIGATCNLNCSYCYYLHRPRTTQQLPIRTMSEHLLEEYIKQYISAQNSDTVSFCWHGGEPTLLGLDYYKKAVALQKKYSQGKKIINTFQTNGTLIDYQWCKFFVENDILVGLSIDGPSYIHDHYRKWSGGKSSFKEALRSAMMFHQCGVEFNTLTTINNLSEGKGKEIYLFLKEVVKSQYMQFLPVAELITTSDNDGEKFCITPYNKDFAQVAPWSISPVGYGEFLIDIFDYWVKHDVGKIFVQIFDTTLAQWCGYPAGVCTLGEYCSDSLTIEHNGDVYPCDHFAFEEYKLGNILHEPLKVIFDSQKRVDFALAKKKNLPSECLKCKYHFACHGECPGHRFTKWNDVNGAEVNYLCKGLKKFFTMVEPYMEYMKKLLENGLPPAMIMEKFYNSSNKDENRREE